MAEKIKIGSIFKQRKPILILGLFLLVSALVVLINTQEVFSEDSGTPVNNPQPQISSPQQMQEEIDTLKEKVVKLEKTVTDQAALIEQQSKMIEKIIQSVPEAKLAFTPPEPKTLVKSFVLDGVNLFQPKQLEPILKKYRDQELGMSDLKKISDEIGAFYRSKGYVSSIAYLPTQEITNNTVEFKVVEGRVGDITVEKPKHSKSSTVEKRFRVKKGEMLDSKKIEASLERINKNQDRTVRAVLSPGKTPGTSDILLKVEKERSPYHFYTDFNNRGTNTTNERRWGLGFVNTNLLGLDDALSLRFMASPTTSDVYSFSADYNLPINSYDTRLGVYAAYAKADIAGQFAIISPEGKAHAIGFYLTHPLFKKEFVDEETASTLTLASNLTAGFDSIDVHNKILGQETSHDKISAFKGGINFDEKDSMGRAMLSAEARAGIPDFLGSMSKHDVNASRAASDAGGKFQKYNLSLNRTTYLPLNMVFLNTFRFQFTNDPLVTPEQMVLGGADSIRGFPENEYLADYGWIANIELRSPAFLIPSILRVPFDKKGTRLIDAIQFVYFIDAGEGHLNKARVGEIQKKYLVGAGFGLRFDLYGHLRGRLDIGFPTGSEEPSDGAPYRVHYGLQYEW
jgi:hemolysin activation/secretion protein